MTTTTAEGISVVLKKVHYAVRSPKTSEILHLLHGINLIVKPGEMCAIMGASGAGKSTMLDLIAGRKRDGFVGGHILFNGKTRAPSSSHRDTAYVMQDDVHSPVLTVEETLLYSARLRMDSSTTEKDHMERVDELITMLGLERCRHTRIGNAFMRGVSGGERKRVSIGVEIVNMPSLLYLDEPTTGLDSEITLEVMSAVRGLADHGRCVMSTIHQPSPEVFSLFDKILLMSQGRVVYFGPVRQLHAYLTADDLGYTLPLGAKLADFVLLVCETAVAPCGTDLPRSPEELEQCFCDSAIYSQLQAEVDATPAQGPAEEEEHTGISTSTAVDVLVRRAFSESRRGGSVLLAKIMNTLVNALLLLFMFHGLGDTADDMFSRFSCMFNLCMVNLMASGATIPGVFVKQEQYIRERSAGAYGPLAYLLSGAVVHMIVLGGLAVMQAVIVYWVVGLRATVGAFFFFLMMLWFSHLLGVFSAQWVASWSPSAPVALSVFPVMFSVFTAVAGFSVRIQNLSAGWYWASEVSFARWVYEAMCINEFGFSGEKGGRTADQWLSDFDFQNASKWLAVLYASVYFAAMLLLNYVGLSPKPSRVQMLEGADVSTVLEAASAGSSSLAISLRTSLEVASSAIHQVAASETIQPVASGVVPVGAVNKADSSVSSLALSHSSFEPVVDPIRRVPSKGVKFTATRSTEGLGSRLIASAEQQQQQQQGDAECGGVSANLEAQQHGFPDGMGVEVIVRGVSYSVQDPANKKAELSLLQGVDFHVPVGKMCAIMGSSGAGKSTLLDVVAGRKSSGTVQGEMLFDGAPRTRMFHRFAAYVLQDDLHIGSFTVRETLMYAARLRMKEEHASQPALVEARVEALVALLGMRRCVDTVVGGGLLRGISGGERKRLSVGVELVSLPDLVFLDEPTSGLDSKIALEVMSVVRRLADQNRTVMTTIHQPSTEIVDLFDLLLLLSRGRVVYFGPMADAVPFFTAQPYLLPFQQGTNPADWFLRVSGLKLTPLRQLGTGQPEPYSATQLGDMFAASEERKRLMADIASSLHVGEEARREREAGYTTFRARTPMSQLWVLMERTNAAILNDRRTMIAMFGRATFTALLHGTLFYMTETTTETKTFDRISLSYSTLMFSIMGQMPTIAVTVDGRAMYLREKAAGAYGTAPFFNSLMVRIVWSLASQSVYALICYFLTHKHTSEDQWWFFYLVIMMATMVGQTMCQTMACLLPNAEAATGIFVSLILIQFSFSGFPVMLPTLSAAFSWIPPISSFRWGLQAMLHNEFGSGDTPIGGATAEDWYKRYGFDQEGKWESMLYLAIFVLVFRFFTYLALKFKKFTK